MKTVMAGGFVTPATIELQRVDSDEVVARVRPDPGDPVFAGHYPGFPLLPGVHIFEFVDLTVRTAEPDLILDEIELCRFLLPAGHADDLVVRVRRDGARHRATVAAAGGETVAEVVLRYRNGATP
ncbi:hypothetical protein [Phytohabitans suffuscus]|nr:hypothetical protein [Phytohabitans suffuscus]